MFDQILQVVKEHLSSDPQVAQAVPADKQEAVSKEIATQINDGLQAQQSAGGGGLLGGLASGLGGLGSGSGNMLSGLLEGNVISGLASKLGLPASATSAISAALPGLLQKIMQKFGGSAAAGLGNLGGFKF
jgi:hypothetical protein